MRLFFVYAFIAAARLLAARTASVSVCWMCHSSSPGRPMGTPSRRKRMPLSTSFCRLDGKPVPRAGAARNSVMTAALTPAPMSTSGPLQLVPQGKHLGQRRLSPAGSWRHRRWSGSYQYPVWRRHDRFPPNAGNINAAVQCDGLTPARGIQQLGHGGLVQPSGGQRTDDEAVCPSIPQGVDLGAQQVDRPFV